MDTETLRNSFQLDPAGGKSLQQQIADYFRRLIQSGTLKEGDQMIPEMAICEALNVSRTTARLAIAQLLADGLIVRYRGKGTFVAGKRMNRPLNYMYNFTENIRELGSVPSSTVLRCEIIHNAPEDVVRQLQLSAADTPVFFLSRVRCADGAPMLVEGTWIPYGLCPGIEQEDFSATSLYYTLSGRFGLNLYHATETIEAVLLTRDEADLLRSKAKQPGFRIRRTGYLDTGLPFEVTVSTTRADKCIFRLELYKNASAGRPPVNVQRNVTL